jgi:lipopolysaccharide export system protein LptA
LNSPLYAGFFNAHARKAATIKKTLLSKIRAFMKTPLIRLFPRLTLLAVCAVLGVGACWAEKADRNKPMNIEADSLRYDDLKQTSVFTGNVVLTKGSIIIRGGQLDVRQDPQGFQFGLVVAEPGKLAFFRQKRDGVDEFIEGEAEIIEYDGKADTIRFAKKAQLRRFKGAVLNDEMSGGVITYDNTVDVFTIDGSVAKGAPGAPPGRVRAMLTPKPEAAANAVAPAASAVLPALRATPALGAEKK